MNLYKYAQIEEPIIITGETGTGKSHLAKKLHKLSSQASKNFIQLNVSTLSENLFESELFGHVRGAFTGANSDKVGFCEKTKDGILFLDEIGELSLEKQAKLLTLIEEKTYFPVGSSIEKRFMGRFIFATNRDLANMVASGKFREDLYYRIRFFEVKLEPLRRRINLEEIITKELQECQANKQKLDLTIIDQNLLEKLVNYKWPGNYRELKQTLKYFVEMNELPQWVNTVKACDEDYSGQNYQSALAAFERKFLKSCMEKQNGRINRTAQLTGLSKPTLISKLKKYGIDRRLYNVNYLQKAG